MALSDNKVLNWTNPVVNQPDRPIITAAQLKAVFDSNSGQLQTAINALIDALELNGASLIGSSAITGINGTTVRDQLVSLASKYSDMYDGVVTTIVIHTGV
jgi:hypothetical protein